MKTQFDTQTQAVPVDSNKLENKEQNLHLEKTIWQNVVLHAFPRHNAM